MSTDAMASCPYTASPTSAGMSPLPCAADLSFHHVPPLTPTKYYRLYYQDSPKAPPRNPLSSSLSYSSISFSFSASFSTSSRHGYGRVPSAPHPARTPQPTSLPPSKTAKRPSQFCRLHTAAAPAPVTRSHKRILEHSDQREDTRVFAGGLCKPHARYDPSPPITACPVSAPGGWPRCMSIVAAHMRVCACVCQTWITVPPCSKG